ncbi:hypothetical protein J3F84DRAFT_400030 [Trichoderma pleuroticola]
MVADKAYQPTSRDEFEIAIVCTRALEYDAVCLLFDEFWDTDGDPFGRARGDPNTYTTGCMGKYNIVVVLLCSSGKANAAGAAASLRSSYPCIELLLLTGTCEGVPDANGEELLLGDVVVSETVIQYDLGTQHVAGFKEKDTLEDRHGRANKNIRNFIANVKTEMGYQRIEEKAATFLEKIQSRTSETKYQRRQRATIYIYPGSVNDVLFESSHCHRHYTSSQCVCADYNPDEDSYAVCDESRLMDCEQIGCELSSLKIRDRLHQKSLMEDGGELKSAQIPSIFFGRFGSGDTAVNSGVHRDSLAKRHGIIAFEMEGAGIWEELPCIIVKGVSGYGDGHKTRNWAEWQNFAAATAVSVARALIERYPQTDRPPVIELKTDKLPAQPQENKETKGGLLLDAYIWIIRNEEFMQWLDDPQTRLLWIKGDPGKGKTMLLCGIINELNTTSPRGNIFYFLCQATDDRLNNASAILRGLLHMMVVQQPSLVSYIRHEYDKSGKSAFEGINSWVVLSRIFEQMLQSDLLKSRKPIFIIDALDGCVADSAQLLEMIVRSSTSSSQAKWLVSSRNEADIQEALATAENKSTVSLELNAESVSTAISTYIRHKVQILANKKGYTPSKRKSIEKYLSDNANGTFLWVALVCALLDKAPRSDPLPKSADFPPGLDKLYERMIGRVCDSSISDIGRKVLAIATVAYRPLTNEELIPLINNHRHEEIVFPSEYDWEDILGHCGSFLTMRGGTIYFVHQSAKDFLVQKGSKRLFPKGEKYTHIEIFEGSVAAMRNILRRDMYSLIDPAFSIETISQHTVSADPLIPIKYGCVYWIDHFEQSISKGITGNHDSSKSHELIHVFLKEKYIYWLEALSLLRSISDGIARMQRLEQLVAKSEASGFLEFVRDACKFIQTFGNAIADYPLQAYMSALIFSPTQSITRHQFKTEAPKWIKTLLQSEAKWAPSSRTYECSKNIHQLAVSCCGTWIAGSHSETDITIWETYSGKIIRHLKILSEASIFTDHIKSNGCHLLTPLSFSPWDRKELVSSSRTYRGSLSKLVVWDVTTGKASQQLQIEERVTSISYLSSACNILVYLSYIPENDKASDYLTGGSQTLIASIWNTKTGQRQITKKVQLQGPSSLMQLPIFTDHIAWHRGSYVEIIHLDTGSVVHILKDYERGVLNMNISPDGSFLVVQEKKMAIKTELLFYNIILSNISSGKTHWSFQIEEQAWGLTFSPDGKLLAFTTGERIELLSTISGKRLQKIIMRHDYFIFSPNGNVGQESLIGTSPGDNSLGKNTRIFSRSIVSSSPNGRIVASGFMNRPVIEVMEFGSTNSTRFLRIPDLMFNRIRELLFSPDSKQLVAISVDALMLWDISSKNAKIMLMRKRNSSFSSKSVFSSDSKRLATVHFPSFDSGVFEVQVWDTASVNCLMRLEKRITTGNLPHILFSPDNNAWQSYTTMGTWIKTAWIND